MIEQVGNALTCVAKFTKSKLGQTGLTVTVDVDKYVGTTRTAVVTGASAVEGRNGDYCYQLAVGSVDAEALYVFNFHTSDTTVDCQDIGPMGWCVGKAGVEDLDAAVTTRSSHSATDVWAVGSRTLTSVGTLIADLVVALLDTATTAAHRAAGSIGRAIGDAGSAADPLENAVPGAYLAGSAGYVLGMINSRIGSGYVTYLGPVAEGGNATIVRGDSYNGPPGHPPLSWSSDDWDSLVDGVGVATVTFTARAGGSVTLTKALTVMGAGTALQEVRLSLTAAETTALAVRAHTFDIQASWVAGAVATLIDQNEDGTPATLVVREDQTRPA